MAAEKQMLQKNYKKLGICEKQRFLWETAFSAGSSVFCGKRHFLWETAFSVRIFRAALFYAYKNPIFS